MNIQFKYRNSLMSMSVAFLLTACGTTVEDCTCETTTVVDDVSIIATDIQAAKAQLGVLAEATVEIYELGVTPYKLIATETTSTGSTIEEIGNFNAHSEKLEADKFYLYNVRGGVDMDADDDGIINEVPTINKGIFHAIVKGESAKKLKGDFKVTAASELLYKKVKEDIDDVAQLEERLTASAKEIFQKDINNDLDITNEDILQYNPIEDKEVFHESYQDKLPEMIKDIHEDKEEELTNQAPIAYAGKDKSIILDDSIELKGSSLDMDGQVVSYLWSEKGKTLSTSKKFKYTPDSLGVHTLMLTVTDNDGEKSYDSINITVLEKSNAVPSANSAEYTLDEDTEKKIILTAKDEDNDSLTYKILVQPTYGSLVGKAPNLLYKPETNYNGKDRFIFSVNDGKSDSEKAIISLNVKESNDKPVIVHGDETLITEEDTSKTFTLKAEDVDNDTLTYSIVQQPLHGKLTHKKTTFIYTPNANYNGDDSFSIKVNDGQSDSLVEHITIKVTPVNDAPTVDAGDTKSTLVDTDIVLKADAKDIDGEIKSYKWFEEEKTLGSEKTLTYSPETVGAHTISVTVTDDQNLSATDRVIVTATEQPNAKPKAQNQSITLDEDTKKTFKLEATDADNDDVLTYKVVQKPKNGTLSGKAPTLTYTPKKDYYGEDSFTFIASDGKDDSNEATVSLTVTDVEEADTVKPVITLKGTATVTVIQGATYTELGATAKDDRDGTVTVETTGTVTTSKVGTYTVTYTATDKAGNSATTTRTIKVVLGADTVKPVITLKGAATATVTQGSKYTELGATAKDDRDGDITVKVTGTVNVEKAGTYTITYTATDKAGNSATTTRTVKVILEADTIQPVISLKGRVTVTVYQGKTYTDLGATAKDNRDGTITVTTTGNVDTSKVGTYTITYTARDKAGNKATMTRTVNVILPADTVKPVITLNGEATITLVQGASYTELGATAKDNRDATVTIKTTGTVKTTTVGTYTVTYTATDKAGNKSTKTRTVKVILPADKTAPVITLNGEATITLVQGASYTELGATAKDNRDATVTIKTTGTVKTTTVGTYTVTYTATDKAGNKSTKTRTVKVVLPKDIIKPVITLNGATTITVTQGKKYTELGATATDDRDGIVTVKTTGTVTTTKVGTYTVTYTATDKAANTTTKTRTVKVVIAPTIKKFYSASQTLLRVKIDNRPEEGYWVGIFTNDKKNTHEYLYKTKTLRTFEDAIIKTEEISAGTDMLLIAQVFKKDSWEVLATSNPLEILAKPTLTLSAPKISRLSDGNFKLVLYKGEVYPVSNIKTQSILNNINITVEKNTPSYGNLRTDRVIKKTYLFSASNPKKSTLTAEVKLEVDVIENPLSLMIKQKLGQNSYPNNFTTVENKTYFTAKTDNDINLYITDGTSEGTYFLKKLGNKLSISTGKFMVVKGSLFFDMIDLVYNVKFDNAFLMEAKGDNVAVIDSMSTNTYPQQFQMITPIRDENGKLLYRIKGDYYLYNPSTGSKTAFNGRI